MITQLCITRVGICLIAGMSIADTARHLGCKPWQVEQSATWLERQANLPASRLREYGASLANDPLLRAALLEVATGIKPEL